MNWKQEFATHIEAKNTLVHVTFDTCSFDLLPDIINRRRYCIVTYGEPYFASLVDRLTANAGAPAVVIDDVAPNPDFTLLSEQASRFRSISPQPEVFVAVGGGSVIDTAKVLASAGGRFERVKTFLMSNTGEESLTSTAIIAVPTTAGTGSEVTCWATVWDNELGRKYSLNRSVLYPEHAVVDPELTLGKSRRLTVSTGLDALSHALESIWNVNATAVSVDRAVKAATEILDVLPRLANDLGSLDLRTRMAGASLMSGLAFSNTKTAIAHSISYPISLRHHVTHGIACSFTLPIVLQSVADDESLCGATLKKIFGDDLAVAPRMLIEFLESLGVSPYPKDHGITQAEWRSLVDDSFESERGLNFIGTKKKFHQAALSLGMA